MDLVKIHTDAEFSNARIPEGQILTYISTDESGNIVTKFKDSEGNTGTIAGSGSNLSTADVVAGYFINTDGEIVFKSLDGTTENVQEISIVDTGVEEPDYNECSTGGMDLYKCASVDTSNKTWTGYKTALNDGVYNLEETVTEGLTYGIAYMPETEKVYNADCTISVENMYMYKKLFFGATNNNNGTGISASFTTAGKSDDAYLPYRANITESIPYVSTGQTENKESWSSVVIWDAARGVEVSKVIAYVHGYTELDNEYTVTGARLEGSNGYDTWDVLSSLEGVNSTGIWTFSCSTKKAYKSLRIVFVSAQDGSGAILWKVDIEGFYKHVGIPDATPYNPNSVESGNYTITYSYTWWNEDNPWKAFNFGENASMWGSDISDNGVGQWIAWENNEEATCIKRYQYRASSDNTNQGCALQGFDEDSGEWITIDEQIGSNTDGVKIYTCSTNTRAFRKHRFVCTSMGEGAHFQLSQIAAWTY